MFLFGFITEWWEENQLNMYLKDFQIFDNVSFEIRQNKGRKND